MTNDPPGRSSQIQSVLKAIDLLFVFRRDETRLTVSEVASHLSINRTTAWRYLTTLCETGLVQEISPGHFALGSRLLDLADIYMAQWGTLHEVAVPLLSDLRDRSGETAALHVREGWNRVIVAQAESRHAVRRVYPDLGRPVPLHLGAPSLVLLAWMPNQDSETYLEALGNEHSTVDVPELREELEAIRQRGYATSVGSRTPSADETDVMGASVAGPIRGPRSEVLAALNITGPASRVESRGLSTYVEPVLEVCSQISRLLGLVT